MLKEQLINLGFTPNEADIYITLNELGRVKAGEIIKKTSRHRNIVYEALEKLIERRLVAKTIHQGVAYFRVLDPSRLLEEIKYKETLATEVIKQINERHETTNQEVEIYEGIEGIKAHRNKSLEVLKSEEEILIFGGSKVTNQPLNNFWQDYHRKRSKAGIAARILFNVDSKKYGSEREDFPGTKVQYLPNNMTTPAFWEIWSDRVAIGTMEGEPVLLSIKNKKVAEGFRNYFDFIWNQKVKTFTGLDSVQEVFRSMLDELHTGEEYYVLGATWGGKIHDEPMYKFFQEYHIARQKKGVKVKLLFGDYNKETVDRYQNNYKKFAQVKFLPYGMAPTMQMNFYRNKIFMVIWQDEPMVIEIENQKMVDNFKLYFDSLWENGEKF